MKPTTQELAVRWLRLDQDEETRAEILQLLQQNNTTELEGRLRQRIAFGTAGLRSSMKAGFAHMNSLNVITTSAGLADYALEQQQPEAQAGSTPLTVAIGYDGRHRSEKFARLAAATFLERGMGVLWFGRLVHTPMVPFAVTRYHAAAGVMITASHNPKNDNGYKVYWSNGSQIIPPHDHGIAKAIEAVESVPSWDEGLVDRHPRVQHIYDDASKSYFESIRKLAKPEMEFGPPLKFVYTPMHGVGLPFMQTALSILNIPADTMHPVPSQASPDPEFPTVAFPNPEEKGALDLAIAQAKTTGIDLILANDPDADRFCAAAIDFSAEPVLRQLTGNQIGILLASYLLETRSSPDSQQYQSTHPQPALLTSTVSSRMLSALAAGTSSHYEETLTGFKWLGNAAQSLPTRTNGRVAALFAFEEALGFMFPSVVWDKDGVAAASVFLAACRRWRAADPPRGPWEQLRLLQSQYGCFADANTYVVSPGPAVTDAVFAAIRNPKKSASSAPAEMEEKAQASGVTLFPRRFVGARRVLRWRDLTLGFDSAAPPPDHRPALPVDPSAQMITCELEGAPDASRSNDHPVQNQQQQQQQEDRVVLTVRASGTEPKIKMYIEANALTAVEAQARADEVREDLLREWFPAAFGLHVAGT